LSAVERTENNKKQALRAFRVKKYRVAIDFFHLPSSQRQMKSILSLRSLRLCGEKENENKLHKSTNFKYNVFLTKAHFERVYEN
jgi:hypothetical protein